MKIALVCPFPLNTPGGVREHVFGLYREFKKEGHRVKIIFPRGWRQKSKDPDIILLGTYLKIPSNKDTGFISLCNNSNQKIQKMLEKEKFDVIHFHEPAIPFLNIQILNHSRSLNIATLHAYPEASQVLKTLIPLTKGLQKRLAEKFNGVIAVSTVAKKFSEEILKDRLVIIPNGVDLSRFTKKAPKLPKFQDGKLNILFVGRLTKRKGLLYLLKAFRILRKKYPNIRLIIVGDGEQKEKAREFVREHKIKEVVFEESVSDKILPSYYSTADIFCSPATEGESFGIVLLEAMASGTPIVAYANAGYKQVLKGFGKRSLVPPKDVDGLARKLEELIGNEKLRDDLKKWGQKEVKQYSWKKVAGQVLQVYKRGSRRK